MQVQKLRIVSVAEFNTMRTAFIERIYGDTSLSEALLREHEYLVMREGSPNHAYIENFYVGNYTMYNPSKIDEIGSLSDRAKDHCKRHIQARIQLMLKRMEILDLVKMWVGLPIKRKKLYVGKYVDLHLRLNWASKHADKYKFFTDRKHQPHLQNIKTGRFVRMNVASTGRVTLGGKPKAKRRREVYLPFGLLLSEMIGKERPKRRKS